VLEKKFRFFNKKKSNYKCDRVLLNTTWSQLINHWESIRNRWHLHNFTIRTTLPFFKSIVLNDRKCWFANVQPLIRSVWICKINPLLITRYDSLHEAPVKLIFQQFFADINTTLSVFLTQFMRYFSTTSVYLSVQM